MIVEIVDNGFDKRGLGLHKNKSQCSISVMILHWYMAIKHYVNFESIILLSRSKLLSI